MFDLLIIKVYTENEGVRCVKKASGPLTERFVKYKGLLCFVKFLSQELNDERSSQFLLQLGAVYPLAIPIQKGCQLIAHQPLFPCSDGILHKSDAG